jgi:hypothetical protein
MSGETDRARFDLDVGSTVMASRLERFATGKASLEATYTCGDSRTLIVALTWTGTGLLLAGGAGSHPQVPIFVDANSVVFHSARVVGDVTDGTSHVVPGPTHQADIGRAHQTQVCGVGPPTCPY